MSIDNKIRELRHKAHRAKVYYDDGSVNKPATIDLCYQYLEELNRLQRERFSKTGKFFPHSNGKIFTYYPEDDMWLKW